MCKVILIWSNDAEVFNVTQRQEQSSGKLSVIFSGKPLEELVGMPDQKQNDAKIMQSEAL